MRWNGFLVGSLLVSGCAAEPAEEMVNDQDHMVGTGTWTPMSTVGQPTPRLHAFGVWTGSEMLVIGGYDSSGTLVTDAGGAYDPVRDTWRSIQNDLGFNPWNVTWTGGQAVAMRCSYELTGPYQQPAGAKLTVSRYDVALDAWLPSSAHTANAELADCQYLGDLWTGSELVVVAASWAAAYQPSSDTWRTLAAPQVYVPTAATWNHTTGELLLVAQNRPESIPSSSTTYSSLRYSPATDTWSAAAPPSFATDEFGVEALFTVDGAEMAFGQIPMTPQVEQLRPGMIKYDAVVDRWEALGATGMPSPRGRYVFAWTGTEALMWGGRESVAVQYPGDPFPLLLADGAGYDPTTQTWTPIAAAPTVRQGGASVWTGSELLIWGGAAEDHGTQSYPMLADGVRFQR